MNRFILPIVLLITACTPREEITPLPHIYIHADTILWKNPQPVRIDYFVKSEGTELSGKIHYRGGSSSKYHKHSYALKLNDAFAMAELPRAKAFVLNASYIDKTLMRHRLSFQLFRDMQVGNIAPLCRYAELSENADYRGIYVVMQRINAGMLDIKGVPGAALWKEPLIFYEVEPKTVDTANKHSQKYPKLKDTDYTQYLDSIQTWIIQSSDSVFATDVCALFDCDNLVDWQLILLLSNNSDGQLKNFYLYRTKENDPFRVALWDYDHSFGRDGDGELNMLSSIIEEKRNPLMRRLYELNPNRFNERMMERYHILRRQGIFSEDGLFRRIELLRAELQPHIIRNIERWPHDAHWYHDDMDFNAEVELIKQYIELRLPMLDERFEYRP
jgi:spore coat protein CotH